MTLELTGIDTGIDIGISRAANCQMSVHPKSVVTLWPE